MEDALASHPVVNRKTEPDQRDVQLAGQGVALAVADDQVRGKTLRLLADLDDIGLGAWVT